MPVKVKRGLGLLVVAVAAVLLLLAVLPHAPDDGVLVGVYVVTVLAAAAVALVGLIGGLGLLAWGLLRD